MRARWQVLGVVTLCASCDLYFDSTPDPVADAVTAAPADARPIDAGPYVPPPCPTSAPYYLEQASCSAGQAWAWTGWFYRGAGSHSMCSVMLASTTATCASGCAIPGGTFRHGEPPADITTFVGAPQILCSETPEATLGDACNTLGTAPCLPTRARLNADGTVASQDYLACGASGTCVAAPAPVIAGYLQPCDPALVAQYATPGTSGLVPLYNQSFGFVHRPSGCLVAWNTATQTLASGVAPYCVGDWQCPAGSLCDDAVPSLAAPGSFAALCKPGPRGTLTPAMLSPDWLAREIRGTHAAMFVDATLAARIDRVEARLSIAVASAVAAHDAAARISITSIGDGAAVFARPGSPINKLIGAGFAGPFDEALLGSIEATWRERDEPVRVELATLASPEAAAQLSARGYRLLGFENVLVRSLAAVPSPAEDVRVAANRDDAAWMRVLVEGFVAGDGTGQAVDDYAREAIEQVMSDFAAAAGFERYVAQLDGEPAGAATMRIDDGIALLCGATTLPAARRRGVQAALLATRLADARAAGCELAVVTTAPGSLSQKNTMRSGFALGYSRAILVR